MCRNNERWLVGNDLEKEFFSIIQATLTVCTEAINGQSCTWHDIHKEWTCSVSHHPPKRGRRCDLYRRPVHTIPPVAIVWKALCIVSIPLLFLVTEKQGGGEVPRQHQIFCIYERFRRG